MWLLCVITLTDRGAYGLSCAGVAKSLRDGRTGRVLVGGCFPAG